MLDRVSLGCFGRAVGRLTRPLHNHRGHVWRVEGRAPNRFSRIARTRSRTWLLRVLIWRDPEPVRLTGFQPCVNPAALLGVASC